LLLLFFEPSTRTHFTFWQAGTLLECRIPPITHPELFSSAVKGESFLDALAALTMVRGVEHLCGVDGVVIRHPKVGAAREAAEMLDAVQAVSGHAPVPVINAGDGTAQHPTQALTDLVTIFRERPAAAHPLEDLTIVLSGDLRYGRTVNSLLHLLGRFGEHHRIRVICATHPDLGPKEGILYYLVRHGVTCNLTEDFEQAIREANVVYMTRIQRERLPSPEEYARVKGRYVFRPDHLSLLRPGAFVMHPLPINRDPADPPAEIDDRLTPLAQRGDPRCAWFRQSHYGYPLRAALLDLIFYGVEWG
jgi:aspartate carbamoyltransferase catalytic subunit